MSKGAYRDNDIAVGNRRCPVEGCDAPLRHGHLMCLGHWRMVPRALQAEVNDSWHDYRRAVMDLRNKPAGAEALARLPRYRLARDAAINHVNALLKPASTCAQRAQDRVTTPESQPVKEPSP